MKEHDYETRIMGSELSVSIVAEHRALADAAYERMVRIAEEADARFSRFRPESELSRVNEGGTSRVSTEFMRVFLAARALSARTNGAFNPLFDITRFGYDADLSVVKGEERSGVRTDTPYNTDLASISFDEAAGTITLLPGQALDFNAFLKGDVAERMASEAADAAGVIVNLGGDIFTRGRDAEGMPFVFFAVHPDSADEDIAFLVENGAVATSGTYNRHWRLRGAPFHHILAPGGEGNPAPDIVSATVLARTGGEADAFATAAIALGHAQGAKLLDALSVPYLFIRASGEICSSPSFPALTPVPAYA